METLPAEILSLVVALLPARDLCALIGTSRALFGFMRERDFWLRILARFPCVDRRKFASLCAKEEDCRLAFALCEKVATGNLLVWGERLLKNAQKIERARMIVALIHSSEWVETILASPFVAAAYVRAVYRYFRALCTLKLAPERTGEWLSLGKETFLMRPGIIVALALVMPQEDLRALFPCDHILYIVWGESLRELEGTVPDGLDDWGALEFLLESGLYEEGTHEAIVQRTYQTNAVRAQEIVDEALLEAEKWGEWGDEINRWRSSFARIRTQQANR